MRLIPGQTQTRLGLFGLILVGATLAPASLAAIAAPPILTTLLGMLASVFGGLVANDMGELAKRLCRLSFKMRFLDLAGLFGTIWDKGFADRRFSIFHLK